MSQRNPLHSRKVKSYSKDFCSHNKPQFQQRFKSRDRVKSSLNSEYRQNSSKKESQKFICKTEPTQQIFQYSKTSKNANCKLKDVFNQTSSKLQALSLSHHNPQDCLCAECTCGRHLCQFHPVRPDFTKSTVYRKDYMRKKPIQNKINIKTQYDRLKGPLLDPNSIYSKQFNQKPLQVQRPRPKDLLMGGGPLSTITSYISGFPGHVGSNQYVKPTDKHVRGDFPLNSKSTYSNTFTTHPIKKAQVYKTPDNLKSGSNWYGTSTYSGSFKQPNPEDYAMKYKIKEKLQKNPNYKHQFETLYRNQFTNHEASLCPAKVVLQTRAAGFFSGKKRIFGENSDFKSLDPSFKSISTSKFA